MSKSKLTLRSGQLFGCLGQLFWLGLPFFVLAILQFGQAPNLAYSDFRHQLQAGNVEAVVMEGSNLKGKLKKQTELSDYPEPVEEFTTVVPDFDQEQLGELLLSHGVDLRVERSSGWLAPLLLGVLPWVLLLVILYSVGKALRNRLGGQGMKSNLFNFGRSQATLHKRTTEDVTFGDVAGLANAKADLVEIVDYLRQPGKYQRLGARIPRGVLLMGPPGTGKTLLARAVAGEAEVPFFSISGSHFIEMFVGVGASRVRDLFEQAKKAAPSIIFIDEIDSVGRSRGTGMGGGNDEREQTLNQILAEMDGFSSGQPVVVLAATNRPDVLDPALTRPGRFDRTISTDLPRRQARLEILRLHSRGVPLAPEVHLPRVAERTVGFSGAELRNLVNEAALLAGREGLEVVGLAQFEEARDRILLGSERDEGLEGLERERVAYHESGHALVASLLPEADPLRKVTIIPRGRALGVTEQAPEEDRHSLTQGLLTARLTVLLAGREAEYLVYQERTSGAADDLKRANQLARKMVAEFGMSERLGPTHASVSQEHPFLGREMARPRDHSESTARLVDEEVRVLLDQCQQRAAQLLRDHRSRLDNLAHALLEHESLSQSQLEKILAPETQVPAPR
ncbi:MAG: ATP-dependent zinc metalloprotease FtsH [Vulcanimicrobiota bacterium]